MRIYTVIKKIYRSHRILVLCAALFVGVGVGFAIKAKLTQAQACSGCRVAALSVSSASTPVDLVTSVSGSFSGGQFKSGGVCYPRTYTANTLRYRLLDASTLAQVYPASGYNTVSGATLTLTQTGSNYTAGAGPCPAAYQNIYSFTENMSTAAAPEGTYIVEVLADSVYSGSGNTSTGTGQSPSSIDVAHAGGGQITLSGMTNPANNQTIAQNATASWNITLSCTGYSGSIDLTASTGGMTGVTLQWYSGVTLVGTGTTLNGRSCGENLSFRIVTGSSTSPLVTPGGGSGVTVTLSADDPSFVASSGSGQATLQVNAQPRISAFSANPTSAAAGGTTQVSWTTQYVNTSGCAQSVSSGSASGWSSGATSSSGSNVTVTLNSVPTTLVLTCSGLSGTTAVSTSTVISSAGGFALSAAPNQEVVRGNSINFIVTASCTAPFAGPITGLTTQTTTSGVTYGFVDISTGNAVTSVSCGGQVRMVVSANSTATAVSWPGSVTPVTVNLRGTGSGVGTLTGGSYNLTIWGLPVITSFAMSPSSGPTGTTPQASWTTQYAGSCMASSAPTDSLWNGSKATSGTNQNVSALSSNGTYNYTLTCGGGSGTASTSTTTVVTISAGKIKVDLNIDGTNRTYPASGPSWDLNYYIIDRTNSTVLLSQGIHADPLEITSGLIPGHSYELVIRSPWASSYSMATLYRGDTNVVTDASGNPVTTQTFTAGNTLTFRINMVNIGSTRSPVGSGCTQYNVSDPYMARRDFRLGYTDSVPYPIGSGAATVNTSFSSADFSPSSATYFSVSPTSMPPGSSTSLSPNWSTNTQNLREAPGMYIFYVYSSQYMSGSTKCSEIYYMVTVDPVPAPTYTFSAASTTINFTAVRNGSVPASQNVLISNTGNQSQTYTASGAASWLTASPTSFSLAASATQNINFQPNTTNLAVGTYSSVVRVMNTQGVYVDITVNYTITSAVISCPSTGNAVNLSSSTGNVGATASASAPAGFSGGSFSSSNASIASVSGTTVTAQNGNIGSGIAQITGSGWTYSDSGGSSVSGCTLSAASYAVKDFDVVASVASQIIVRGGTANLIYTVTAVNGFTGTVSLSQTGAPPPGVISVNPTIAASFPQQVTVSVQTTSATAIGAHQVRLTGTSGGQTRYREIQLWVVGNTSVDLKVSKDGSSWTDGPLTIGYNWSPYLRWTSTSTTACTITGNSGSWVGLNNASQSAGNQTTNQTYTASCDSGTVTDTATINVFNTIPTSIQVANSTTDGTVSCGQVKVTWAAASGASSYKVYRNTVNNTTGAIEVDSGVSKTGTSYTLTPPDTNVYYYFVKAVDASGNESNYSAASGTNSAAAIACSVDLSTSDVELSQINTTNNSPTPTDCDRNTQSFSTAQGLLRKGNKITFKVNICNSGTLDFSPTAGSPITVTSTLANLSFLTTQAPVYNCGGCSGSYQLVAGSGSTPDVVVFTLTGGTLAHQSGGNPSVWSVTFAANTRSPSTSSATIFRFNNRTDIKAGSVTNSYSTPYYFFYFNQASPVIREVSH